MSRSFDSLIGTFACLDFPQVLFCGIALSGAVFSKRVWQGHLVRRDLVHLDSVTQPQQNSSAETQVADEIARSLICLYGQIGSQLRGNIAMSCTFGSVDPMSVGS